MVDWARLDNPRCSSALWITLIDPNSCKALGGLCKMKIPFLVTFGTLGNCRFYCFATLLMFAGWADLTGQIPNATPTTPSKQTNQTVPATDGGGESLRDQSKIKVVFDPNSPGVVIIESNGEKIRVDTVSKTVESFAEGSKQESPQPDKDRIVATSAAEPAQEEESAYDFDRGEEPYDFRVVNVPTPKNVPKGSWNLAFTHRFTQPIHPVSSSGKNLLGLDSFGIASFGISYGITDKLYVSAYRSPLCQRGLCRVIEVGLGYNWLSHDKKSPVALTTYASIEGNDNFTEEYTYNFQTMISGRIGKRVYLFFSPALHLNSNGQRRFNPRSSDFFPPATAADTFQLPTHGASFGFGASVLITPNVIALFDFVPRTGFKLGQVRPILDSNFRVTGFVNNSQPSIGFGIQRNVGRHAFALTFSNTQATTTSRYNSSNLANPPKRLIIGFNLSRRF